MTAIASAVICVIFAVYAVSAGKIPDYIHVCKRSDPQVGKCVRESIEVLRPKLKVGIPELDVPSLEPLHLDEVVISRGGDAAGFRLLGKDVVVHGASDFTISKIKIDVPNMIYRVKVKIPILKFEGTYDVNARLLGLPIAGEGKFRSNATNCIGNAVVKAELIEKDGVKYIHFKSIDMDVRFTDYSIYLDGLFGGDRGLSDQINSLLNQNKEDLKRASKPVVDRTTSEVFLDLANKIVKNFSYDEVFPEK